MAHLRPADAQRIAPPPRDAGPDFEALVGPFGWRRLHPEVRRRFSADGHDAVTYPGRLDVMRNWAGLTFALAAKALGGPLPLAAASDAGALVCVRSNGQGGVIWERWLELKPGRAPLRIASTKQVDESGRLLECVEGGLGMALRVFERDHGLVFESQSYFLTLAGRRWTLPGWATPGVCRVAHHHVAAGEFRFTLTIDHPWFGRTFTQSGIFIDANAC
jgi:hypothetical protein